MKKIIPEYRFTAEQLNIIQRLAAKCGLLPDTVKILFGRGIDDEDKIEQFLHPSRRQFISPFKMQGMDEAVKLLTQARAEKWSVVIYGDYDADGICAATIAYRAFNDFGIEANVYIPERRDGYGLSKDAVDTIFDKFAPDLFVTVDCGISGFEEVEYIKRRGARVIVTDHHELPTRLPDCICINPKFNDGYIYDNLCGAGVALKLAVALNGEQSYKYLDFATIATIADSVPLTGENRSIVSEGLKLINKEPRSCYSSFFNSESDVTAQTLSFGVAPKINAAGRMGDAYSALSLFTSKDENEIFDLSAKLVSYNLERQKYCDELYASVKQKIKQKGAGGNVIMLWDEGWNTGFVGIVAARISEEYSRPALLFVKSGDKLKGSVRSVEGVNVFEALKACEYLLVEYGGHAQAAGAGVTIENFEKLEITLNEYFSKNYSPSDFEPAVYVAGNIDGEHSERLAREIELLEPFGVGNRRPAFVAEERASRTGLVKPFSPHVLIKGDKTEFMFFGGAKFLYLLNSNAPKSYVFEYNVSTFRGKEYIKGFIRDVIVERNAGEYCAKEIAVNEILTLACPKTENEIIFKKASQIDELIKNGQSHGIIYIASDYSTISRYKNLTELPIELFNLSSGNLAATVLVSPRFDSDLSEYEKVVFLDRQLNGVRISSLAGKEIVMCEDICGYNYIKGISTERDELLKIYSALFADVGNIDGGDSGSIALSTRFNSSAEQTAFALEVFEQLGLICYKDGKFKLLRGVKTELGNSELYNILTESKNKL